MFRCTGYAAEAADKPLAPFTFERRDPGPTDVAIDSGPAGSTVRLRRHLDDPGSG